MLKEKVSVIMGVYNEKKEWLDQSINSILNQSYRNIEFIIVLDNPNNIELKEFLTEVELKDSRVKLIINEKNLGLVKTLNLAIKKASGEYIARMDADDIADLQRIEKQITFFEKNPDVSVVGTKVKYINEKGEFLKNDKYRPSRYEDIKRHLKFANAFAHPTLIYKTSAIRDIDGYKDILYAEDYDLVTRFVMNNYKVHNLDEYLLNYRIRANGISESNRIKQFITSEYIKKIYRKKMSGKECSFNKNALEKLLENEKLNKKYSEYFKVMDEFGKKRSLNNCINLIKTLFTNYQSLKIIFEKTIYYLQRKIT